MIPFHSTRNAAHAVSIDEAIRMGLAPDGGLFAPAKFPSAFASTAFNAASLADTAERSLKPYFAGSAIEADLRTICRTAFDFPAPLTPLDRDGAGDWALELFHGPTAAFKDFGARFLAQCLARLAARDVRPPVILAATSGDTGGAVAAAVTATPGLKAAILFPRGGVSPLQERQLCCWPANVLSLRVNGDFDACQALVKHALADPDLRRRIPLSSANSINIARLLAQIVYYARASFDHQRRTEEPANFIVPTGNLGNALACVWAREMGAPIARIHIAVNANRTLADYAQTGEYRPRPATRTMSNAMDVGAPSNFERLESLLAGSNIQAKQISVSSHDDRETAEAMTTAYEECDRIFCPHTSVALAALQRLERQNASENWIVAATAHAAKFNEVVQSILGVCARLPLSLQSLQTRPIRVEDVDGDYDALKERLLRFVANR